MRKVKANKNFKQIILSKKKDDILLFDSSLKATKCYYYQCMSMIHFHRVKVCLFYVPFKSVFLFGCILTND